jgi:hypothetical protein
MESVARLTGGLTWQLGQAFGQRSTSSHCLPLYLAECQSVMAYFESPHRKSFISS